MTTYHCDGFKPITQGAEIGHRIIGRAQDAARVFGERLAKRRHGKRGACANVRFDSFDSYRQIGASFEVFVGIGTRDGGTSGCNERLYITVRD